MSMFMLICLSFGTFDDGNSVVTIEETATATAAADCWKPSGAVHCADPDNNHQGTPITHSNCSWNRPPGDLLQQCNAGVNGADPQCPNPYWEKYADDPFVYSGFEAVTNGTGKSTQSTAQKLCFVRRTCTCSEAFGPYENGLCIGSDTLYGNQPHQHNFYRTHPMPGGLGCEVIDPRIVLN